MLARMAPDDAADLIGELDRGAPRADPAAAAARAAARKVRTLLGYNPSTAGGLMSPDFVGVHETMTVADGARPAGDDRRSPRRRHDRPHRRRRAGAERLVSVVTLLSSPPATLLSMPGRRPTAAAASTDADLPRSRGR